MSRLRAFAEKCRIVGEVRGKGLMIGLELVRDRATKEPAADEAKAVRDELREAGFLVGRGGALANVIRLQPPLSITAEQCDRVAEALEKALAKRG
jgi:4-aminobutyrate aminotransferase-like enzyme